MDSGTKRWGFVITSGGFESASVEPSSFHAFQAADYVFKFTPKHPVPQYGLIMVEYPEQVNVEDPSLSQTLCRDWRNFPSEAAVCTIFTANRTIIVNKGFQAGEGGLAEPTEYSWVVPYVTNPATLIVTDSFKVTTRD